MISGVVILRSLMHLDVRAMETLLVYDIEISTCPIVRRAELALQLRYRRDGPETSLIRPDTPAGREGSVFASRVTDISHSRHQARHRTSPWMAPQPRHPGATRSTACITIRMLNMPRVEAIRIDLVGGLGPGPRDQRWIGGIATCRQYRLLRYIHLRPRPLHSALI